MSETRITRKESVLTVWPADGILTVKELKEFLATIPDDDSHLASCFGYKEGFVSMVRRAEIDITWDDSRDKECYTLDLLES
jgi:hypothetical protein